MTGKDSIAKSILIRMDGEMRIREEKLLCRLCAGRCGMILSIGSPCYFSRLQPLPGEGASISAGMLRMILSKGWQDRAFCARQRWRAAQRA